LNRFLAALSGEYLRLSGRLRRVLQRPLLLELFPFATGRNGAEKHDPLFANRRLGLRAQFLRACKLWLSLTPWPDLLGLMVSIAIVPALSFLGARLWAFSHPRPKPDL
jgi:hypothetical protein